MLLGKLDEGLSDAVPESAESKAAAADFDQMWVLMISCSGMKHSNRSLPGLPSASNPSSSSMSFVNCTSTRR